MKKVLELTIGALFALKDSGAKGPRAESIESHLKACASNAAAEAEIPFEEVQKVIDAGRFPGQQQPQQQHTPPPEEKAKGDKGKGDDKGKGGFTLRAVMALVVIIGAILLCVSHRVKADSFNPTNVLNSGDTVVSWPTNVAGTNGIGALTGGAIDLRNNEWAGFYFSGLSTTNTNTTVTAVLIGSSSSSQPLVTFNTNGVMTRNDWDTSTNAMLTLSATSGRGDLTAPTNWWRWTTNIPPEWARRYNWAGLWSLTNNNANGQAGMTNFDAGLNKKIIPIRYP